MMPIEYLTDEQVLEVYDLTMRGYDRELIGREYGITRTEVAWIKTGKIRFSVTQFAILDRIRQIASDCEIRSIPGFEGYFAVDDGRIISTRFGDKILKGHKNKEGYLTVLLNNQKRMRVHRLILMAFKPESFFEGAIVMHLNGKRWDNHIKNLKWGTKVENNQDVNYVRNTRHLVLR
jgi:hypothetical protein